MNVRNILRWIAGSTLLCSAACGKKGDTNASAVSCEQRLVGGEWYETKKRQESDKPDPGGSGGLGRYVAANSAYVFFNQPNRWEYWTHMPGENDQPAQEPVQTEFGTFVARPGEKNDECAVELTSAQRSEKLQLRFLDENKFVAIDEGHGNIELARRDSKHASPVAVAVAKPVAGDAPPHQPDYDINAGLEVQTSCMTVLHKVMDCFADKDFRKSVDVAQLDALGAVKEKFTQAGEGECKGWISNDPPREGGPNWKDGAAIARLVEATKQTCSAFGESLKAAGGLPIDTMAND